MKTVTNTYIDLKPVVEQIDPPSKHPELVFTIHRNAKLDVKHEVRKYTVFAAKTALRGLKMAVRGVEYGLSDMIMQAERQRAHSKEMAKVGVTVKYSLF